MKVTLDMDTVAKPFPGFVEFARELNSTFLAPGDHCDLRFELIEATSLFSDERSESFSLIFRAPAEVSPEQGVFSLCNTRLGSIDLFLVPVNQTSEGVFFEASFNLAK